LASKKLYNVLSLVSFTCVKQIVVRSYLTPVADEKQETFCDCGVTAEKTRFENKFALR